MFIFLQHILGTSPQNQGLKMKKKILVQSNGQLYNVTFKNIILLVFHATELVLYVRNPKDDTVEKLPVTRKVHWRSELEFASDFERVHKKCRLPLLTKSIANGT